MTLRVTLEIVPFGVEADKRKIGCLEISNMAQRDKAGNTLYRATYCAEVEPEEIEAEWYFGHKREDGAPECVFKALQAGKDLIGPLG